MRIKTKEGVILAPTNRKFAAALIKAQLGMKSS